jgi:hypothetical protein
MRRIRYVAQYEQTQDVTHDITEMTLAEVGELLRDQTLITKLYEKQEDGTAKLVQVNILKINRG